MWSGICQKSNQSAAAKHGKQIVVVISATESCGSLKVVIQSQLNCAAAEHRVEASTLKRDNFPKSEFLRSEESQVENVKNAIDIFNKSAVTVHRNSRLTSDIRTAFHSPQTSLSTLFESAL